MLLALRRGPGFERLCVLKRLHTHHQRDPAFRQMLFDEARIAGLVRHPNVVSVFDVGEDAEGPYLLMDFVEGLHLGKLIESVTHAGDRIPIPVALEIAHQVALGLNAVHELRAPDGSSLDLVHRDVSPQNILIGFDGVVRVTDFGIAKAWGRQTQTTTGILKGKAGYLAPEQLRFEDPDRRTDLFSFGVVLAEMLLGQRLYLGEDANETARLVLNTPPVDVSEYRGDAPPALVDLCFGLLAGDRESRPATAALVAAELEEIRNIFVQQGNHLTLRGFLEEHFSDARSEMRTFVASAIEQTGPTVEIRRTRSRRARWLTAGAVAALSGAIAGGFAAYRMNDENPPANHDEPIYETSSLVPATDQVHVAESLPVRAAANPDPSREGQGDNPASDALPVSEPTTKTRREARNTESPHAVRPPGGSIDRARARRWRQRQLRNRERTSQRSESTETPVEESPTERPSSRFWGWP